MLTTRKNPIDTSAAPLGPTRQHAFFFHSIGILLLGLGFQTWHLSWHLSAKTANAESKTSSWFQYLVHAWQPELVFFPLTTTNKIRRTTTSSPFSNRWGSIAASFCNSLFCHSFFNSTTPRVVSKVAGIDLLGLESGLRTPLPPHYSLWFCL